VALYFADECVSDDLVAGLRRAGFDVLYAREVCAGTSDRDVLRLAAQANRVLITDDFGFGELAIRQGQAAAGIIILSLYALPPVARGQYAVRGFLI
jgi:predicted nuclease of predicted toxin-antitoxin system